MRAANPRALERSENIGPVLIESSIAPPLEPWATPPAPLLPCGPCYSTVRISRSTKRRHSLTSSSSHNLLLQLSDSARRHWLALTPSSTHCTAIELSAVSCESTLFTVLSSFRPEQLRLGWGEFNCLITTPMSKHSLSPSHSSTTAAVALVPFTSPIIV